MSLIDIAIEVVDHPLSRQLLPLALQSFQKDRTERRIQLHREAQERQIALLREAYGEPQADPTPAHSKADDVYSQENRYDTGCVVCGKAHLAATAGMLERAAKLSAEKGQCDIDCAYYVAAAQREVVNLIDYDWTPDQIAATPPKDQAALTKWLPALNEAQDRMFVGTESNARLNLARAAGALEEAGRFARSSGVDHPEAQKRIADAEAWLATTERAEWSPERRAQMDPAIRPIVDANLPKFRKQRQFLLNGIQSPEDLDRVAADVGVLNAQIQGVALQQLTAEQVQAMAHSMDTIRRGFRADVTGGGT